MQYLLYIIYKRTRTFLGDNNENENGNTGGGSGGSGGSSGTGGGSNTGGNNTATPFDPCEAAMNINNNNQLKDSIAKYTNELMLGLITVEKGWIKDQDGNVYTAIGNNNSLTYSSSIISQIKDKEIFERFHTHPSGSIIPSIQDILTMGKSFKDGNINPETFNYGILCAYYMAIYHIESEDDFNEFVKDIEKDPTSFINNYNIIIQPNAGSTTPETQIGRFLNLINTLNIGLKVSFARHSPISINQHLDSLGSVGAIAPIIRVDNGKIEYDNCVEK